MRLSYAIPVLLAGMLSVATQANAATVEDYEGDYDLAYRSVVIDLEFDLTLPTATTRRIPVKYSVNLENEALPDTAFDVILGEIEAFLEDRQIPPQMAATAISGAEKAAYEAIQAINEKLVDLPDTMSLSRTLPVGNVMTGNFSDIDGEGLQFALPGTLAPDTGILDLSSLFYARIDALEEVRGLGYWQTGDIDASADVKGATIRVVGFAEAEVDLLLVVM